MHPNVFIKHFTTFFTNKHEVAANLCYDAHLTERQIKVLLRGLGGVCELRQMSFLSYLQIFKIFFHQNCHSINCFQNIFKWRNWQTHPQTSYPGQQFFTAEFFLNFLPLQPTDHTGGVDSAQQSTPSHRLPISLPNIQCTRRWHLRTA